MLEKIVRIIGGDPHKQVMEDFVAEVEVINQLEEGFAQFSRDDLRAKTDDFRLRLAQGESLDSILPEAYAVVREASKRTIGLRHYDVQMIGGIAMHRCYVAEMKTGEGKTLAATLPLYLNALTLSDDWMKLARSTWGEDPETWQFKPLRGRPVGRGVHLVTVNDYLARRDARWMAPIYHLLGLQVGVLQMAARTEHGKKAFLVDLELKSPQEDRHQLEMVPRKLAYQADVVYGTNNEFGFDYLRDNMAMQLEDRVQRGHHYAIIDEVDNVLIDEARTPLIISGPSHDDPEWYRRMAAIVKKLKPEDYEINIRDRNITLTPLGEIHVEELLGQPLGNPDRPEDITPQQARLLGYLEQALRAEYIFKRNKDYLVQGGKVIIVDEFTGRLMPGRRWSDGLHQAVEAKENVKVQSENVTYATITIQNYFRMYEKLSGMTGTAVTESEEFNEIYGLDPIAIPTNLDYVASLPESYLETRKGKEPETGFEYIYYIDRSDPQETPIFWKRKDYSDQIYLSEEAKLRAIVQEILSYHVIGRPLLVGTTSVENSEQLSSRLDGPDIRTLAYILMIREGWLRKHNRQADGRRIPALQPLNTPLPEISNAELRRFVRDLELDLTLNIKAPDNLQMLLYILGLDPAYQERLAEVLRRGISHNVLNARKHTEESQIIAGAGAFGAVTIATSMAGRGVDIKLGGELAEEIMANVVRVLSRAGIEDPYKLTMEEQKASLKQLSPEEYGIYDTEVNYFLQHMEDKERVKELGGLHVIGSERHEARRIDNQLRGRAARQGDPGSSRFYLSLEDELMARFGGQQMEAMMNRLQVDESLPITNPLVDRVVEQSQNRVEGANFDIRKHLLEYDDVLNTQREKIYQQRERVFTKSDLSEDLLEMLEIEVRRRVETLFFDNAGANPEGQDWRLLSWLEQIQPTLNLGEQKYPSYTLQLMIADLRNRAGKATLEALRPLLLETAGRALQAEEDYMLNAVVRLWQDRQSHYQEQVEIRLESLDTFLDGLAFNDEEEEPRSYQEELQDLLRIRLDFSAEDQAALQAGDVSALEESLRDQIAGWLREMEIRRLIGGVERVLGTELEVEEKKLQGLSWAEVGDELNGDIQAIFADRRQTYLGDPQEGRIPKSIDQVARDLPDRALTDSEIISVLQAITEGRRAAFDKKSHKRVWIRTQRFSYTFHAATLIDKADQEALVARILDHLQGAQQLIQEAWGRSELHRLADTQLSALEEDLRADLQQALGEKEFLSAADLPLQDLPETTRDTVESLLGRFALTKIYRELFLRVISELWVEYLTDMEALRVSIGLEAYAQRDPLVQYKTKGFEMFQRLMEEMRFSVVNRMFTFRPRNLSRIQAGVEEK